MRHNIILPAWEFVTNDHTLKKFNFVPSFLSTVYLSAIILYQIAFSYVYVFQLKDEFFALVIDLTHKVYFWQVLIIALVLLGFYMLITPIAQGGLIALIDAHMKGEGERKRYSFGFSRGLWNFLPIFEFNNITAVFKLLSITTFYLFLLRVFGKDYFTVITTGAIIYLFFAVLANSLFAYTRFFIVFEGKKAFEAMGLSVRMALENLDITFRLYYTLVLVYFRTVATAILFIVFPFALSAILTYVTIAVLKIVAIVLLALILFGLLIFVSHLNSVLEIFVETLWYRAYQENQLSMQE